MAISTVSADEAAAASKDGKVQAWPSPAQAYYTVFVMGLVVMFAEVDRGVMSLLVQAIKKDYQLSDWMMGLLLGPLFAIFYAVCGLPLSRFIDRNNRKNILAVALALWSAATALCGVAQNFVQLCVARLFLGAGESVNGPGIFSIISDSFPKERLPRGIALMQMGVTAGNAFALIMGAAVIQLLVHLPIQHIAGIGVIRWWQMVFIVVGLPGLLVALLVWRSVKEPARRGVPQAETAQRIGMWQVVTYLCRHWRVFGPLFGSLAISALGQGALSWHAAFYQRTYHWSPQQVGYTTGLLNLFAGPVGLFLGVALYEHMVKRGLIDAPMRVVIISRLIGMPAMLLMPLMPNAWAAVAMGTFSGAMIAFGGSSVNAALQIITPNPMRGQVTALYLFLFSVVGNGFSPFLVGMITDFVFHDESQLRYAILTTAVLFGPTSLLVFWLGLKPYAREVQRLGLAGGPAT